MKEKRNKGCAPNKRVTGISLRKDLLEDLHLMAGLERRSRNQLIANILEDAVKAYRDVRLAKKSDQGSSTDSPASGQSGREESKVTKEDPVVKLFSKSRVEMVF